VGGERKNEIFSLPSHIFGCFFGKIENFPQKTPLQSSYPFPSLDTCLLTAGIAGGENDFLEVDGEDIFQYQGGLGRNWRIFSSKTMIKGSIFQQ
jgi:hypothetical protein